MPLLKELMRSTSRGFARHASPKKASDIAVGFSTRVNRKHKMRRTTLPRKTSARFPGRTPRRAVYAEATAIARDGLLSGR